MPLLVSRHLTRLELDGVWFACRCINLDGCPALEHLEINECELTAVRKIMSFSLKHLVITSCDSDRWDERRIQICVPSLISLRLACSPFSDSVRTPLLERMPELVGAEVWVNSYKDGCNCDNPMACYHVTWDGDTSDIDSDSDDDEECSGDYAGQNTTKCVVLEGLAQARDLVLIADGPTVQHTKTYMPFVLVDYSLLYCLYFQLKLVSNYIFPQSCMHSHHLNNAYLLSFFFFCVQSVHVQYILRRDLRWCPTFSKLKTLVLTQVYWREPADCSVLECMLEHAPLLEKATLISKKVKYF